MTDANATTANPTPGGDHPRRLGELLVDAQLITGEQLAAARKKREETGDFLAKILVQSDCLTQEDLNACFVKRCKIPHISLMDYDIGSDVLSLVPNDICLKHGMLPIDKLGRILTIAMVDPLDEESLATVRAACPDLRIKPILCNWTHFEQVTSKYFSGKSSSKSGGGEMSAASLGLSAMPPKAAPKPTPKPAPRSAEAPSSDNAGGDSGADTRSLVAAIQDGFAGLALQLQRPTGETSAPPAAPPAFPVEALAETIGATLRDAMGEIAERQAPAESSPPSAAPDLSGLEASFRAAVDELKDVVRSNAATATATAPPSPTPDPAPAASPAPISPAVEDSLQRISAVLERDSSQLSGEAMAEVIRDSVGGAVQEALSAVVVQMRGVEKASQPDSSQLEAFAETLRDSLGGMMQETLATLMVQLRSKPAESDASMERVVSALRESQADLVSSLREVLDTDRQSQDLQGARLAAIAEAAVESSQQTAQLIEATLVQRGRAQGLEGARPPHASVSPFGMTDAEEDARLHAEADAEVREALVSEVPLETLTFDTFFPGDANAFTTKICEAVAGKPGADYNPLFMYGSVGLGKTHLISAVGNRIKEAHPAHRVGYVSASHFSRRLEEARAAEAQDAFRENYCHWDVLILDDIQFMGGRVDAQEEFFHIFNVLHQQGRQIIIASDNAPDRLGLLERRLVSRFQSGIVVDLKPPEWETRMKILRHHVAQQGVSLPEEVCSLVAMRVSNDVRKMVGALRKIAAFASLSKGPITVEMATEILSHIGAEEAA